jgi:ATP-dependent Clp protease ATP-binding subunit ClpB
MNLNNYTVKAQQAIQTALQIAEQRQQLGIEPGHLLQAILQADEQNISFVFNKLQVQQQQYLIILALHQEWLLLKE